MNDVDYTGLPWKDGGRDRRGVDCAGLAMLWLKEQMNWQAPPVESHKTDDTAAERILAGQSFRAPQQRGDVVFFREKKSGKVRHVAIYLGDLGYLHIAKGCQSRIDRNLRLMQRLGLELAGAISPADAERLAAALRDRDLGFTIGSVILLILSIALAAASSFLISKPKVGQFKNQAGAYGFDGLYTRNASTIPLPDILGAVLVAGNSPYQSLVDKSQEVVSAKEQKANKVVVLCSGPINGYDHAGGVIKINGIPYNSPFFFRPPQGSGHIRPSTDAGLVLNPTQNLAEAVEGDFSTYQKRSSITIYEGTHAISVPVDVRASYDRNFPVYGFSGTAYAVFRLIDSTKYSEFNMTAPIEGRQCRTFDEDGFVTATATSESLAGADGSKVRFKLANEDVASVTSITVNAVSYSEVSEDQQAGTVYRLNALKGYIEFLTAPAAAATITITYLYYPREWTQNPVNQIVYLLTEVGRGRGYDEAKIDWERMVEARDLCDELVIWTNANGTTIGPRFTSNYSVDYRKAIQEHLRAILDSFYGYLFLGNGRFICQPRNAGASVFSFDDSNILKDSFSSEMIERSQRANRVHLFYNGSDTYNAETEVIVDDLISQRERADYFGNDGIVDETLHMLAVDSQAQAERIARMLLSENIQTRWIVKLKTTIKGLALQPGDIVDVTHSSQPAWAAKLFRIEEIGHDEDDRLELTMSEYSDAAYLAFAT